MENDTEECEKPVVVDRQIKCSMCRKIKEEEHFLNPNSESLFHVCDYCRYLRKTKYKKRKVHIELDRPVSSISHSRELSVKAQNSYVSTHVSEPAIVEKSIPINPPFAGIVPSNKWIETNAASPRSSMEKTSSGSFHPDNRYAVNHPLYRFQSILSNMCIPPHVIFTNGRSGPSIVCAPLPPTPKSLIFCCNSSAYNNRYCVYDHMCAQSSY